MTKTDDETEGSQVSLQNVKRSEAFLPEESVSLKVDLPGLKLSMSVQDLVICPPRNNSAANAWTLYYYMLNVARTLYYMLRYNWTSLFITPVHSLIVVLSYSVLSIAAVVVYLSLNVFWWLRKDKNFDKSGNRSVNKVLTMFNLVQSNFLQAKNTAELVIATTSTLAQVPPPNDQKPMKKNKSVRERIFDIRVAETLLALSGLIYHRDIPNVRTAVKHFSEAGKYHEKQAKLAEKAEKLHRKGEKFEAKVKELDKKAKECGKKAQEWEEKATRSLTESTKRIKELARSWNFEFTGMEEFDGSNDANSVAGPFCGVYTSIYHPVMVVAFKGTSVDSFEEILVDAVVQRVDARPYVFGATHQGFYEALFSNSGWYDNDGRDPYNRILRFINRKATELSNERHGGDKIQLWVTGHSLGAGLSTLFFARLLKCPNDLTRCELRDCYTFGSPAVGDSDFACQFASYGLEPLSRSSTLWRVVNNKDVVCKIPLAKEKRAVGFYMKKTNFFNYFHVGHAIILDADKHKPIQEKPSAYRPSTDVSLRLGDWKPLEEVQFGTEEDPLGYLPPWCQPVKRILPISLIDHSVEMYMAALEKAHRHCRNQAKRVLNEQPPLNDSNENITVY